MAGTSRLLVVATILVASDIAVAGIPGESGITPTFGTDHAEWAHGTPDLPLLIGLPAAAVDALLGPPAYVLGPDSLSASDVRTSRTYELANGVLGVAFCNDIAYAVGLTLAQAAPDAAAVLQFAGITVAGAGSSPEGEPHLVVWTDAPPFSRVVVHRRKEGWGGVSASADEFTCQMPGE